MILIKISKRCENTYSRNIEDNQVDLKITINEVFQI